MTATVRLDDALEDTLNKLSLTTQKEKRHYKRSYKLLCDKHRKN